MSQHADFLVSRPSVKPRTRASRSVTLDYANNRYRFDGLTETQHHVLLERFGPIARPISEYDENVVVTRIEQVAPSAFVHRDTRGYDYRIALSYDDDTLNVSGLQFSATVSRDPLGATIQTCLDDTHFIGPLENVFRILVSYRLFAQRVFVMHSAGIAKNKIGYVCFGRSGAGKTTLCELAQTSDFDILSDELNAVSLPSADTAPTVQPMPFAGDFGRVRLDAQPVPLGGMFALAQGPNTHISALSSAQAASRLIASCPYLNADPHMHEAVFEVATSFVAAYPIELLTFTKTTDFCRVLDERKHAASVLST